MAYHDLRDFVATLEREGELLRINAPVSSDLEITEITDRVSKGPCQANKALLFAAVKDFDMPVLINTFGSPRRMCLSLQVNELNEIAERLRTLMKPKVPETLLDRLGMLPALLALGQFPPRLTHVSAPCQEVVITDPKEPMLDKLPILKCWPDDAGKFITLGVVITRNPQSKARNLGIYRLQKYNNTSTGMHWHKHHDGARYFEESRRQMTAVVVPGCTTSGSSSWQPSEPPNYGTLFNKDRHRALENKIEVAVAIGCDPAVTYAATAPLPADVDELVFAGFLRSSPVRLVKCKTVDLEVPANCEIIIEGYVDHSELEVEGPFGDHTGFYSLPGLFPVLHVTAITHRINPIYQTIIVGRPPQEDCYMGKATERIFLPMIQLLVPEIVDINLPWEGVFHNCAIVSIDKRFPGHARKVMNAIWGLGQLMLTKFVIVVDQDVDVQNLPEVALNVFGNTDPRRDVMFVDGPLDILDHSCPILGYGSKAGIDATRKWQSEGFCREWPQPLVMSQVIKELVSQRWAEYGLKF